MLTSRSRRPLSARIGVASAIATALLCVPSAALAAGWGTPTTVYGGQASNPQALSAFGGGVALGDFTSQTVQLGTRSGDTIGPTQTIYSPIASERLWAGGTDGAGNGVLLTVRAHKPYQRVRVVLLPHGGTPSAPRTISGKGHSATGPVISVAPDGSAVAAWAWHDKPGWRVQAAIKPAGGTFGAPVTLSDPDRTRPFIEPAAGSGGSAAVAWQFGGSYKEPTEALHVATAAAGASFAASDTFVGGSHAAVGLGVSSDGHVVLAFQPEYYLQPGDVATARLMLATGTAGAPLSAAAQLAAAGPGSLDESVPVVAFTDDGDALIGWLAPTVSGHQTGQLTIYTRPGGAAAFGAPQVLTAADVNPAGLSLVGGPGGRAVAAWFQSPAGQNGRTWSIHAAVRGASGGAFDPEAQVNPVGELGLWPSAALTPTGDAILTWIHNTDGSGGGQVEASVRPAG